MGLIKKAFRYILRSLKLQIKYRINQLKWLRTNKHNKTRMGNYFPVNVVKVGNWSYGKLVVHYFEGENEGLSIGNYVSIGPDVEFFLGGEHHPQFISNYPFALYIPSCRCREKLDRSSKGPIIIDDDVWIGAHALILSGVHVGKGAIIGAGSVVAKNIPPYAVFAGNKIVKYRFDQETIKQLLKLDYSHFDSKFIAKNLDSFYTTNIKEALNGNLNVGD